jgi:predicted O-methyltransferase YrrM
MPKQTTITIPLVKPNTATPPAWSTDESFRNERNMKIADVLKKELGRPWQTRTVFWLLVQRYGRRVRMRGAEVGVADGMTSQTLLHYMPRLHLTMVDAWKEGLGSTEWKQRKQNRFKETAMARTAPYARRRRVLHMTSLEAAEQIEDESLDFVFLDCDHYYEGAAADVRAYWPKLKPTGIFCGDDYYGRMERRGVWGVARAVNEFATRNNLAVFTRPMNIFWMQKP